jgi:hypothetical protein
MIFVMAGLVPAIHAFLDWVQLRRGCPHKAGHDELKAPIPLAAF